MSDNLFLFLCNFFRTLIVIAAIVASTYLIIHGKDGWGWLIFLALCTGTFTFNINKDEE